MTNEKIKQMKDELRRCKADPVYFYNTYFRKVLEDKITPEQYEAYLAGERSAKEKRKRGINYVKSSRMPPEIPEWANGRIKHKSISM